MRPRHWAVFYKFSNLTSPNPAIDTENFTVSDIWDKELLSLKDLVFNLAAQSRQEMHIEAKLTSISEEWSEQMFSFKTIDGHLMPMLHKQELGTMIERLEESQVSCATTDLSEPHPRQRQRQRQRVG